VICHTGAWWTANFTPCCKRWTGAGLDAVLQERPDAWGRPFRMVKEDHSKPNLYEIRSDGPDKTTGTKDDLSWTFELAQVAKKDDRKSIGK